MGNQGRIFVETRLECGDARLERQPRGGRKLLTEVASEVVYVVYTVSVSGMSVCACILVHAHLGMDSLVQPSRVCIQGV